MGEYDDDAWDIAPEFDVQKDINHLSDVPQYLDVLPDNTEALIVGDVDRFRDYNHKQGENDLGFLGTCGLVSCEDILEQFGFDVDETGVVEYAAKTGLCDTSSAVSECGGTTEYSQAELLTDFGVPAHAEVGDSQEQLAQYLEEGRGTIISVNAGELWDSPENFGFGEANHSVVVTGLARNPETAEIEGFYINDSGRGYPSDSGRFIGADLMQRAWESTGGSCVVTDVVRTVNT